MSVTTASIARSRADWGSRERPLPRHAYRRGTRGFAALAIGLAGSVVLGVGTVVLPTIHLDRLVMTWLIPLTVGFGIAHFVAAFGLLRGRAWGAGLTGYVAAVGVGIAAYGLLVTLTGLDPFGSTSSLPSGVARAQGVGLLLWMTGLWLVAARYAARAGRPS